MDRPWPAGSTFACESKSFDGKVQRFCPGCSYIEVVFCNHVIQEQVMNSTSRIRLPLNRWELSIVIYVGLTALSMVLNYLNGQPVGVPADLLPMLLP
jgi:hypothetical protein